jgi:hypothetical protein
MTGVAEKGAQIQATRKGNNSRETRIIEETSPPSQDRGSKTCESSSESDEEKVDLDDSDKDNDWGEVTDDDADTECLYCAGLFSDDQ